LASSQRELDNLTKLRLQEFITDEEYVRQRQQLERERLRLAQALERPGSSGSWFEPARTVVSLSNQAAPCFRAGDRRWGGTWRGLPWWVVELGEGTSLRPGLYWRARRGHVPGGAGNILALVEVPHAIPWWREGGTETLGDRRTTYHGFWWKPDIPSERAPGTFEIAHDRSMSLTTFESGRAWTHLSPIIVGQTLGGQGITLTDCYAEHSVSGGAPDLAFVKYQPGRAFIGSEFGTREAIIFRKAHLAFLGLREWVDMPAITQAGLFSGTRRNVEFAQPERIPARIGGHAIDLVRWVGYRSGRFRVELSEEAFVEIEVSAPLHVDDWFREYIRPIQSLFTLAFGRPCVRERTTFYLPGALNGEMPDQAVEMVARGDSPVNGEARVPSPHEMIFKYEDVAGEWPSFVARWFSLWEEAGPALSLFFSIEENPSLYVEQVFLSTAGALEAFHRSTLALESEHGAEHKQRLEEILSCVPTVHVSWLGNQLRYSHEPSFRSRLEELVAEADEVVEPFVKEGRRFVHDVVEARNALVHRSSSSLQVPPLRLWQFAYVMSLVMRTVLLRRMLQEPAKAVALVRGSQDYSFQKAQIRL
jgi:hypothetical protein